MLYSLLSNIFFTFLSSTDFQVRSKTMKQTKVFRLIIAFLDLQGTFVDAYNQKLTKTWNKQKINQIWFDDKFSGSSEETKMKTLNKTKSVDRSNYENSCYANDDEDNIVFEDFAKMRMTDTEE